MKNIILYRSYDGNESNIFLRFDKADRQTASKIINNLIDRQFRICYDEHDSKVIADADRLAEKMDSSDLTMFLISADALDSLEFRNCINYALSNKKKVFCIYPDEKKLEFGFDLQLANVPGIRLSSHKNVNELCDGIIKSDYIVQDMRGEDAKITLKSNRKKTVALAVMVSVLVLFFAAAATITVYRINYDNSIAGQLEQLTEADYLDISNESASTIDLLKGKTITTLVARNMGLTDISALRYLYCEELDISGNPKVNTLEPLLEIENLKTVTVTQDMYPAIVRISGRHPFKIIVIG